MNSNRIWHWKCPNIYIDLGSNIGVQIRKIFEPEKYPETSISYVLNKTMKHFAKFLGRDIETRRKHCCVFGFEANPKHEQRLKEIEQCYNLLGWKTHFQIRAVSDIDNEIANIVMANSSDPSNPYLGARMSKYKFGVNMQVHTIDIANWIWNLVQHHKPHNILMKMDIEGAEFKALPKMLQKK
eukprot:71134_1